MHQIDIPTRNKLITIPGSIREMNTDQFLYFIRIMLRYLAGEISFEQFRIAVAVKLAGIRINYRFYKLPKEEQENAMGEVYRISELIDSYFKEETRDKQPVKVFDLSFVKQYIPSVRGGFYGPDDAFQDMTLCEYRTAHQYFREYVDTSDQDALANMIAVLYRPKKLFWRIRKRFRGFNGQLRVPFTAKSNPFIFKVRAERMKRLPLHIRYGIFLWFSGCEEFLKTGRPTVNGHEIDFSVLYQKDDDSVSDGAEIGLVGMLYSMAESKVFGSIEETDNQNIWDIMIRLYQVVTQMKAVEEKYKHGTGKNI